jgi:hypothetical protein
MRRTLAAALTFPAFLLFAQPETPVVQPVSGQGAVTQTNEVPEVVKADVADGTAGTAVNLKHKIYVDIAHIDQWKDKPADSESVVLFLDHLPLKQVKAHLAGHPGKDLTRLIFQLVPNYQNTEEAQNWQRILVSARRTNKHMIPVSVGVPGKDPLDSRAQIPLDVERWYSYLVYIALAVFAVGVVVAGRRSDLLRDNTPAPSDDQRRRYSLARTQMAIWFLLVLAAWCYISLVTQSAAPLSSQVLILIGISGATAITAGTADGNKWKTEADKRSSLRTERTALVNRLDGSPEHAGLRLQVRDGLAAAAVNRQTREAGAGVGAGMAPALVPTNLGELEKELRLKEDRLAIVRAELAQPEPVASQSHGWIRDILSDSDGMSFHRLQIFAWTITLGTYFLWTSLRDLVMPALDDQMLILMGISSGTYLGFKLMPQTGTEAQAAKAPG